MEKQCDNRLIRILIIDDHPIVRAGLATLLGKESDFLIEPGVDGSEGVIAYLDGHPVDIVLLDLRMPKTSGVELLPAIVARKNPPRVIILSSFDYEEEIYRAAKAGACGYLMKDVTRDQLVQAIHAVASGHLHFPKTIAERIAERDGRNGLSPREQDVLLMISKGLTNKEIGQVLFISQFTVRNHVKHILDKLGATDRTEAVSIALQHGVISMLR